MVRNAHLAGLDGRTHTGNGQDGTHQKGRAIYRGIPRQHVGHEMVRIDGKGQRVHPAKPETDEMRDELRVLADGGPRSGRHRQHRRIEEDGEIDGLAHRHGLRDGIAREALHIAIAQGGDGTGRIERRHLHGVCQQESLNVLQRRVVSDGVDQFHQMRAASYPTGQHRAPRLPGAAPSLTVLQAGNQEI